MTAEPGRRVVVAPSRRALWLGLAGFGAALLPVLAHARLWTVWPIYVGWLALALGLDVVLSPPAGRLVCRVLGPDVLHVGGEAPALIEIDLTSRLAPVLEVKMDLSEELAPVSRLNLRAGGGRMRVSFMLKPVRRGTARIEAVWVRYGGPLGLMKRTVMVSVGQEIPVVPSMLPPRSVALRSLSDREVRAGVRIERFMGEGTEFDSLREFSAGDDNRTIHWKASARHRKLVSRQFRAERNRQVILAVDSGRLMSERLAGIPKLDHALNAALLLSYVSLRGGDRVGLMTFDSRVGVFLQPQAGIRAHKAMAQMTSRVSYSDEETNFTLGLTTLIQRVRRRSLVVVMTDFVDTVTAELMLENMQRMSRHHLVVFVALRDPHLAHLAASPPTDSLALSRAVVAQSFLSEREVVLAGLRRIGVVAIDAPPDGVGARLINTYVDIKRRELI